MNLQEYIQSKPIKPFRQAPAYFQAGDFLLYLLTPSNHVAERVDDILTVYLDRSTRDLVGVKVKGVRRILDTIGEFGVGIKGGDGLKLGLFFRMSSKFSSSPEKLPQAKWYSRLEQFKDVAVPSADLAATVT